MKKTLITFLLLFLSFAMSYAALPLDRISERVVMVGFRASAYNDKDLDTLKSQISKGLLAGVILYGYNIKNRDQVKKLISELNSRNKTSVPLLIAVDEEGGSVQRLTPAKGFNDEPSPLKVAETLSSEQAELLYEQMAKDLSDVGFNMNFAPGIDLNINPSSPVIGAKGRSYGRSADTVVKYAKAFINAHRKYGIITCLKHFPGHGSAKKDSHLGFTDITATWSKEELEPYRQLIKDGYADMVMTSHMYNAKIDRDYPATLSKKHVKLLRDMGYKGIIISDDMQMGGLMSNFGFTESVHKALQAGNDILVFSNFFFYEKHYPEKVRDVIEILGR